MNLEVKIISSFQALFVIGSDTLLLTFFFCFCLLCQFCNFKDVAFIIVEGTKNILQIYINFMNKNRV
jgi:hypothetical protein